MITELLALFSGGAALNGVGALGGLLGGWLAKREQRKLLELTNDQERFMADIDLKRDTLEHQQALAVLDKKVEHAQAEGEIAADIKASEAFADSQKINPGTRVGAMVKSAVRPVITGLLLYMTWDIYMTVYTLVDGFEGLSADVLQNLFVYIVHSIIFLTITATAWWFASRGEQAVKAIKSMIVR